MAQGNREAFWEEREVITILLIDTVAREAILWKQDIQVGT